MNEWVVAGKVGTDGKRRIGGGGGKERELNS